MSEESKKVEKKAEQTEQEIKADELSEKDLNNVAGGASYSTSKSNIKKST
jgi:bacteriocin-like protein